MLPTEKNKNYPVLLLLSLYLIIEMGVFNAMFFVTHFFLFDRFRLTEEYRQLSFLANIMWIALLFFLGDIRDFFKNNREETLKKSLRFVGFYISLFALCVIFLIDESISKVLLAYYLFGVTLFIPIVRVLGFSFIFKKNVHGSFKKRAVFIGHDDYSEQFFKLLDSNNYYGMECLGFFDRSLNGAGLGELEDFYQFDVDAYDYIYVSWTVSKADLVQIISHADKQFKKVKVLPNPNEIEEIPEGFEELEGMALLEANELPLDRFLNAAVKRTFDIAFSLAVMILVLSWLFPLVSLLIVFETRGPVLFRQIRNGNKNTPFVCLKFRTMVLNTEADTKWATKNDPRITRLGSMLRKTSIDELPQFFNVLKGEMSIVGPRPLPVKLNDQYKDRIEKFLQRHSYKPGITGLAQSMGFRGEIETIQQINARVKLDRFYLQKWSFFFDLKIMLDTIRVLFKGQDKAY